MCKCCGCAGVEKNNNYSLRCAGANYRQQIHESRPPGIVSGLSGSSKVLQLDINRDINLSH